MAATDWLKGSIGAELSSAELGDPRRSRRLGLIADRLAEDPSASFPKAFASPAELEGFYRFVRSDAVGWEKILQPHAEQTLRRAEELGECLVIHDTTEFVFSGEREGLGRTASKAQGFMGHISLVVATDEARTPLGVAAAQLYARTKHKGRRRFETRLKEPDNESLRWQRGVDEVETQRKDRFECVHVADREGDIYPLFSRLIDLGTRFVIRACRDRTTLDEYGDGQPLHEALLDLKPRAQFDIAITARGKRHIPTMARAHPSRYERLATVSIAAMPVTLPFSRKRGVGESIEMNLVRVWEAEPPEGQPPVEWLLWTSDPISTVAEMRRIVDYYRSRWVVEEYFKALKTGCRFEKRQLESFQTLTTALAVFAPVAWRLLLLRSLAQSQPDASATAVLSKIQVKYLENKYGKPLKTAREALLATAKLGGHLTQNGEPGWQTLGKGYEKLLAGEAFAMTLMASPISDQS